MTPTPRTLPRLALALISAVALAGVARPVAAQQTYVLAWNDLGMHCMDPDYSVFTVLPPYNDLRVQLVVDGQLVTDGAPYNVRWRGIADATGSINTTSIGKTNFWEWVEPLFGVTLPLDVGLAGDAMPGATNSPQPTHFDATWNWFGADGIPITPIDDDLQLNTYPLTKVIARGVDNQIIATTKTVLPVSQELECAMCHASGSSPYAMPSTGWVFHPDPLKDDRLNILKLHDKLDLGTPAYDAALAAAGYRPDGLYKTVTLDTTPILCDRCHGSNALPGTGLAGVAPLTQVMHGHHAGVTTPNGSALDADLTRNSCFACHPGEITQCLRGAMGKAVGADGNLSMDCQSCHADMVAVGDPGRVGWLEQPNCQQCHTGTATLNAGAIRFESVFDGQGLPHVPADPIFATTPDVPAAGFSLYRFSEGHGGLQCAACHGPPHAIYPTDFDNDNVQSVLFQGHAGTISDCTSCHSLEQLDDVGLEGPHGMHPITLEWVRNDHKDPGEHQLNECRACHGVDLRGTVLSLTQADRTWATGEFGTKTHFEGGNTTCYGCHNGPSSSNAVPNAPPVVTDKGVATPTDIGLPIDLTGSDANGDPLTYRIVRQARHGRVGLIGATATYRADPGYQGPDTFTFAAFDTKADSNLGNVSVDVGPPDCAGTITSYGFGCPGSGGALPVLALDGCASDGRPLGLTVTGGLGGAAAVLALGPEPGVAMLEGGCVLRVDPLLVTIPVTLGGSGPGAGTLDLDFVVPPGSNGLAAALQVFVFDPGTPWGYASTNGVEVVFQ